MHVSLCHGRSSTVVVVLLLPDFHVGDLDQICSCLRHSSCLGTYLCIHHTLLPRLGLDHHQSSCKQVSCHYSVEPSRFIRRFKPSIKSTFDQLPARNSMSKRWGSPEPNDFENFLHRSISDQETPKREVERMPKRTAKSATPSPMPRPKTNSDFVAWGEYTGNGKDEDLVAWKKRQLGEAEPASKDWTTGDKTGFGQSADRAKENKAPSRQASPQSTRSKAKQDQPTSRQSSTGTKTVKKG